MQDEVNSELNDKSLAATSIDGDTFTGVFFSKDLELHGELKIDLASTDKYAAVVNLLNGKELKFRAQPDKNNSDIVHFKGQNGSFTLDFTNKSDVVASGFLVDDKEGHIKVYRHARGVPPAILFGSYVDDLDPAFTGAWDMIAFGAFEPTIGPPFLVIDEIIISHLPTGMMYFDETFGDLEPFLTSDCLPFPPDIPVVGAFTDGMLIQGVDQIATFAGVPTLWTILGVAPFGIEPGICDPLPPGIHGFWDRGPRFGTISILTPGW